MMPFKGQHIKVNATAVILLLLGSIVTARKRPWYEKQRRMKFNESSTESVSTESSLEVVNSTNNLPLVTSTTISPSEERLQTYDKLYSNWSAWHRCTRRCRQSRTRHCKVMEKCGTDVLREERTCFKDRCKDKPFFVPPDIEHREELVEQRGNSPSSEFRVLYHLQNYVYSDWSNWSPCTRGCRTRRSRTCELALVCGSSVIQEDALCYIEGTSCERLYNKKRKRKKQDEETARKHPLAGLRCGVASKNKGLRNLLRIIGGREAEKGSWPWQVTILNKFREPFCGGTLLASRWVLTAAHCVRRRLFVRVGEHDLMVDEGTEQETRVIEAFLHPAYDAETVNNDIALLLLRNSFELTPYVQPACLPSSDDDLPVHARATILGWGKRRNSAVFGTDVLHQAEVPIVDIEECRDVYDSYHISDHMMCAGYKRGRVDSCAGDSGGPLLYRQNGRWVIYGITSFGEGCGQKGKFGIYAKVASFVKWIKRTIGKYS